MHRPPILVTGSSGLIGRVVAERLASDYDVRGLDLRPGPATILGDARDVDTVRAACRGTRAILHLAGDARPDAPWETVLEANIVATRAVFEAARLEQVERVVMASSNRVVGMYEAEQAPGIYELGERRLIGTSVDVRPDSLYAVSKVFGEALGRYYCDNYGIRVICLRLGSVVIDDDPWLAAGRIASGPGLIDAFRRYRATWLSQRDCVELVVAALAADVRWAVVYGVSDNPGRFWDLGPAERLLGFRPRDAAPKNPPAER